MNKIFLISSSSNIFILPHKLSKSYCNIYSSKKFSFSQKVKLDPYLILEVNRNADWKTIKLSYFKLARLYHPDLNKNDEVILQIILIIQQRAHKKFLQIKEAYEYFERKYNPEKYANIRQSFTSKFEDETQNESKDSKGSSEDKYESIREKNKKKRKSHANSADSNSSFQFKSDSNFDNDFDMSGNYFRDEQLKLEVEKQKYISKFLFAKIPVPRSSRMIDRLKLSGITIAKGKIFGPEDYISFTILTILILFVFFSRKSQYKRYTFENLENVNIYNALKPSEINKIYEDNEISPAEMAMMNTREHKEYKDKKLMEDIISKTQTSMVFGGINDVPKLDIRGKFKESLKK